MTQLQRPVLAHTAWLGAALALWLVAVAHTDVGSIGTYGLVEVLPATWWLALALTLAGFAFAVSKGSPRPAVLIAATGILILILHGTTALLYDEPRYVYVYKHLALIDLIGSTGHVDRSVDIYNNWPGFFAINAWLSRATGASASDYANWAPVAFNVLAAWAVRFALRGLTKDERVLWVAVWLFLLANWVAQDYLAPQAMAFVLALVVLGLCLRWQRPGERPLRPVGALVVGGICFTATVVSHQLTPVALILSVAALAFLTDRVPRWVPAAMLGIELVWVALAWGILTANGSPISLDVFSNTTPPVALGTPATGFMVTSWAARLVGLIVGVMALAQLWRRRRAGLPNRVVLLLCVAPALVVLGADYGGEGGLRSYLFALPWLSFLGAELLTGVGASARRPMRAPSRWRLARRVGAVTALTSVVAVGSVQASFGRELLNRMTPDDVATTTWFERHATPGSALVTVTANAPYPITGRYATLERRTKTFANVLTEDPVFIGHTLGTRDLPTLNRWLEGLPASRRYVALTPSQEHDLELNRTVPAASIASLGAAMANSDDFTEVFRSGDARIYRWR